MSLADLLSARALVYDIETRPMCSFHWQAYGDQSFGPEQVLDPGGVLCWSARWLNESKIRYMGDHHDGHEATVAGLWELLDAADVVIGYNQVRFDDKRMNREFVLAGLPVPSPSKPIDLLRAVKARFGFPINKLQHVAQELEIGSKVQHSGWKLWRQCITDADGHPYLGPTPQGGGDPKNWALMKRYCMQDVKLTTDVYHRLRPWIKNHPHVGLYGGAMDGCPNCGGVMEPNGVTASGVALYGRLRCTECGANARTVKSVSASTATRAI